MRILIIPMFALSPMNGPWSRARRIADAFQKAGHEAILGMAPDGNCSNTAAPRTLELPAPAPLGAPMAIAKRTFPLATKLGIAGRKPVRSFEEVLWLTGNIAHDYIAESVEAIRRFIRDEDIDAVYSEFSIPAIIAARAEGIALFGSISFPTQTSYASSPGKSAGVRRLLEQLNLPNVDSSLELFEWLDIRFVPSCPELEPFEDATVSFCGFLENPPATVDAERNALVFYLGTGTVPKRQLIHTAIAIAGNTARNVYVANALDGEAAGRKPENLHLSPRFDFSQLLPETAAFVNHGGQNSIMDSLAYGAPQIVFPGKVFERQFNAQSIQSAGAGICLREFNAQALEAAFEQLCSDESYRIRTRKLRERLSTLGGAARIVSEVEAYLARASLESKRAETMRPAQKC